MHLPHHCLSKESNKRNIVTLKKCQSGATTLTNSYGPLSFLVAYDMTIPESPS